MWRSLDNRGPYSEVKHSASIQSSSLAEREAVVASRFPRLYLYLRREMGRRTSSSRLVRGHRGFKSVDKSVTARYGTNTTLFLSELRTLSCRVRFVSRERKVEKSRESQYFVAPTLSSVGSPVSTMTRPPTTLSRPQPRMGNGYVDNNDAFQHSMRLLSLLVLGSCLLWEATILTRPLEDAKAIFLNLCLPPPKGLESYQYTQPFGAV
jgi:hypothetical protein